MLDKFVMKICWGSARIDLHILNLGITLKPGVNLKLCLVYPSKNPQYPFNTGPGTGVYERRK
jgi:hypothetical protein